MEMDCECGKRVFRGGFHLIIFGVSIERRNDKKQLVDLLCFSVSLYPPPLTCSLARRCFCRCHLFPISSIALQISNSNFYSIDERVVTFVVTRRTSI